MRTFSVADKTALKQDKLNQHMDKLKSIALETTTLSAYFLEIVKHFHPVAYAELKNDEKIIELDNCIKSFREELFTFSTEGK